MSISRSRVVSRANGTQDSCCCTAACVKCPEEGRVFRFATRNTGSVVYGKCSISCRRRRIKSGGKGNGVAQIVRVPTTSQSCLSRLRLSVDPVKHKYMCRYNDAFVQYHVNEAVLKLEKPAEAMAMYVAQEYPDGHVLLNLMCPSK